VKTLLMGGQACVFYGAAEFSRDLDLLILSDAGNIAAFHKALADLKAESIAVPPFDSGWLAKGHALHFRCHRPHVEGLRIDVMALYRGGAPFNELWQRRTTIEVDGESIDLLSLPDLVTAKKTQRDKDWPMIGRLVERFYFENSASPSEGQIEFLLNELRTPVLLMELTRTRPDAAMFARSRRQAVAAALSGNEDAVRAAIELEEQAERNKDREFWQPLKRELEELRHRRK